MDLAPGEFRVEGRKDPGEGKGWGLYIDLRTTLGGVCILKGSEV